MRARLGVLEVRKNGDKSGYTANMTRGVPQAVPCSPALKQLLVSLSKWINSEDLNMVRASLGVLEVRKNGDLSGCTENMTRGAPQDVLCSPVYFNVYIDDLAWEVRRRAGDKNERTAAVTLVAGDVLLQATYRLVLQKVLDAASW